MEGSLYGSEVCVDCGVCVEVEFVWKCSLCVSANCVKVQFVWKLYLRGSGDCIVCVKCSLRGSGPYARMALT